MKGERAKAYEQQGGELERFPVIRPGRDDETATNPWNEYPRMMLVRISTDACQLKKDEEAPLSCVQKPI